VEDSQPSQKKIKIREEGIRSTLRGKDTPISLSTELGVLKKNVRIKWGGKGQWLGVEKNPNLSTQAVRGNGN